MATPSLRKSINAFCRSCIYDPKGGAGTWRQQVAACTSRDCPLWKVRPQPRVQDRSESAPNSAQDAQSVAA